MPRPRDSPNSTSQSWTFEFKVVPMKPVGQPRLTEKGRPNSEGGVRSGLGYHPKRRSTTYQEHHQNQRCKAFCLPGESTHQGPPTPFSSYNRTNCHKGLD